MCAEMANHSRMFICVRDDAYSLCTMEKNDKLATHTHVYTVEENNYDFELNNNVLDVDCFELLLGNTKFTKLVYILLIYFFGQDNICNLN